MDIFYHQSTFNFAIMCFMPMHQIKMVSYKNIEISLFKGRIIVNNSLRAHIWAFSDSQNAKKCELR